MKLRLAVLSVAALVSLIGISFWATSRVAVGPVLGDLVTHPGDGGNPWFVATLFDTYFGFFWFWAWIAYKETSHALRLLWLVLILGLGNMAMASYMLIQLWKLPKGAGAESLLLRRA